MKSFVYCRKSSEDDERQILSLPAQASELTSLAAVASREVVALLDESMTARKPGRPVFNDMLRRIMNGEAECIITWKLDRLARNLEDGGRIIELLQRGIIKEIRTCERVYLPADNVLLMVLEFGMANQYVRDLSVNIRRGQREKIRRGEYPFKAPVGYYNDPKSRTIVPHPQKFEGVKRCLERFASGG
ncbi:MAG TPA: recombinase family protein, partial [Fimbriimonas sp.]|nr:recombinase family protein [Fimbriimonas sp.]